MKRSLFYLLVSAFFQIQLNAQKSPGYIGHHSSFGYELLTTPLIEYSGSSNKVNFSIKHELEYTKTFSRKSSFSLGFSYSKGKQEINALRKFSYRNYYIGFDNTPNEVSMNSLSFSFDYNLHMGKNVAPMGSYVNFGLGYVVVNQNEPFQLEIVNDSDSTRIESIQPRTMNALKLKMGLNKKIIFDNLLYLGLGVEFSTFFGGNYQQVSRPYDLVKRLETDELGLLLMSFSEAKKNIVNAKIGIGKLF